MSLINQMLKDLEQRGGFPSDTKFEPANSKSLGTDQAENKGKNTFLKISGALILLYCAVYFWVKNPNIFKAPHVSENAGVVATSPENMNTNHAAATVQPEPPHIAPPPAPVAEVQTNVSSTVNSQLASPEMTEVNPENTVTKNANTISEKPLSAKIDTPKNTNQATETKKSARDIHAESTIAMTDFDAIAPATVAPFSNTQGLNNAPTSNPISKNANNHENSNQANSKTANQPTAGFAKNENALQKSANLYSLALKDFEKGRSHEAEDHLSKAITESPSNEDARQMLAALMVDNKKMHEAQSLLAEGLTLNPHQTSFRMSVARIQFESGDKQSALETLLQGEADAKKDAEYQNFLATLLQRAERHEEAITHFSIASQLQPLNPNTFVGLGVSLQTLGKNDEAQNAYARALSNENLTAELRAFLEQRLKQVKTVSN